jgi:hypothetical protein
MWQFDSLEKGHSPHGEYIGIQFGGGLLWSVSILRQLPLLPSALCKGKNRPDRTAAALLRRNPGIRQNQFNRVY